MKVRDLVQNTVWIPGSEYAEEQKPAISVLLPTFRRGASGLFRKAVESVLNQTLRDIELIIVDDASTDGTADQIAEFMQRDGRISCLRHPLNIGLPAISEFEAFMKARADYIAFAFDDDFFYPDALEKLLEHSLDNPGRVCFGSVMQREGRGGQKVRLGVPLTSNNLRSWNSIPNCAVLLHRDVIERVGLYDPHILMTRVCDWDLWRRIGEHYLLHHVEVDVGEVTGPETDDSLGRTHFLSFDASEEWMRGSLRNLKPQEYLDLDVFAVTPELSSRTRMMILELRVKYEQRGETNLRDLISGDDNKVIFVLTPNHDASTTLCFDYLPPILRSKIRIIRSSGAFPLAEIANASCIIVVRYLAANDAWAAAAKRLKIPIYYFLDDNLPELVSKEGVTFAGSEIFEANQLRVRLRDFTGILVSSPMLVEYFEANLLHPNVQLFPVSYAAAPPEILASPKKVANELVVASMGGRHRQKGLQNCVLPALRQIATKSRPIHVIIGGCWAEDFDNFRAADEVNENIQTTLLPLEVDWTRAVFQIASFRPDILVHAPSKTLNNKYKTLNVALCAYVLDAVLVAPNDPPYDLVEFDGAAVRVEPANEPRAWLNALQGLLSARGTWEGYKETNAAFCRTQFSGEQNLVVMNEILRRAPAITPTVVESRLKELCFSVSAGSNVASSESLRASLLQLSQMRTRSRRNQRYRPHRPREDIWPRVSPAFEDIRQHIIKNKIRSNSSYLELSDSIHDMAYAEYPVHLKQGQLKSLTCALSSEGIHDGMIGVELIAPDGTMVLQSSMDLAPLNLHLPVTFDLQKTIVPRDGTWHIRFFARSTWPVYVLEFAEYARFGWIRRVIAPFIKIEYNR